MLLKEGNLKAVGDSCSYLTVYLPGVQEDPKPVLSEEEKRKAAEPSAHCCC